MGVHDIHFASGDEDPIESAKAMRDVLGPHAVDQLIRQAIATCWMMFPDEKKNVASVEAEIRRVVDRAIANFKEDASTFGMGG